MRPATRQPQPRAILADQVADLSLKLDRVLFRAASIALRDSESFRLLPAYAANVAGARSIFCRASEHGESMRVHFARASRAEQLIVNRAAGGEAWQGLAAFPKKVAPIGYLAQHVSLETAASGAACATVPRWHTAEGSSDRGATEPLRRGLAQERILRRAAEPQHGRDHAAGIRSAYPHWPADDAGNDATLSEVLSDASLLAQELLALSKMPAALEHLLTVRSDTSADLRHYGLSALLDECILPELYYAGWLHVARILRAMSSSAYPLSQMFREGIRGAVDRRDAASAAASADGDLSDIVAAAAIMSVGGRGDERGAATEPERARLDAWVSGHLYFCREYRDKHLAHTIGRSPGQDGEAVVGPCTAQAFDGVPLEPFPVAVAAALSSASDAAADGWVEYVGICRIADVAQFWGMRSDDAPDDSGENPLLRLLDVPHARTAQALCHWIAPPSGGALAEVPSWLLDHVRGALGEGIEGQRAAEFLSSGRLPMPASFVGLLCEEPDNMAHLARVMSHFAQIRDAWKDDYPGDRVEPQSSWAKTLSSAGGKLERKQDTVRRILDAHYRLALVSDSTRTRGGALAALVAICGSVLLSIERQLAKPEGGEGGGRDELATWLDPAAFRGTPGATLAIWALRDVYTATGVTSALPLALAASLADIPDLRREELGNVAKGDRPVRGPQDAASGQDGGTWECSSGDSVRTLWGEYYRSDESSVAVVTADYRATLEAMADALVPSAAEVSAEEAFRDDADARRDFDNFRRLSRALLFAQHVNMFGAFARESTRVVQIFHLAPRLAEREATIRQACAEFVSLANRAPAHLVRRVFFVAWSGFLDRHHRRERNFYDLRTPSGPASAGPAAVERAAGAALLAIESADSVPGAGEAQELHRAANAATYTRILWEYGVYDGERRGQRQTPPVLPRGPLVRSVGTAATRDVGKTPFGVEDVRSAEARRLLTRVAYNMVLAEQGRAEEGQSYAGAIEELLGTERYVSAEHVLRLHDAARRERMLPSASSWPSIVSTVKDGIRQGVAAVRDSVQRNKNAEVQPIVEKLAAMPLSASMRRIYGKLLSTTSKSWIRRSIEREEVVYEAGTIVRIMSDTLRHRGHASVDSAMYASAEHELHARRHLRRQFQSGVAQGGVLPFDDVADAWVRSPPPQPPVAAVEIDPFILPNHVAHNYDVSDASDSIHAYGYTLVSLAHVPAYPPGAGGGTIDTRWFLVIPSMLLLSQNKYARVMEPH